MKRTLLLAWSLMLVIVLLSSPLSKVQAQATEPKFTFLRVQLWPEYDQPDVLVIYNGEVSPDITLPATLTFPLPAHVEEMHAVAIEENGSLLNADPATIQVQPEGDQSTLSFQVTSPRFQFEYYDPQLLTREDQTRQLNYSFSTAYPIETLTFEVQEPVQSQNFSMTPEPTQTLVGQDGLTHYLLQVNNVTPDQPIQVSATYSRSIETLSAASRPSPPPTEEPVDISVISGSPVSENLNVGYVLVAAGLLLLLGTGGYWWWSRRTAGQEGAQPGPAGPRPGRLRRKQEGREKAGRPAKKQASTPARVPASSPQPTGSYCYRCGTELREDAEFCHVCGTRRRRD
jgi:hypothetical protein